MLLRDDETVHHWGIDAWAKNWVEGDTDRELQTEALLSPGFEHLEESNPAAGVGSLMCPV